MNKKIFRKDTFKKRSQLTEKNIEDYSKIIEDKLFLMDVYKRAKIIMCFISFSDEINTHDLIKAAINQGKTVVVPITIPETKELKISELRDFSELEPGFYNILTPKKEYLRFIDPNTIDLILTPGVVFDRNGYRIGYGGGYYDRFFSKLDKDIPKIGLSFDLQIVDKVPTDKYDIPVDIILTEKEIIYCTEKEILY